RGRSKRWLEDPGHTIWVDEVADINGRTALVAARFRLDPWLKPGGFVSQTFRRGHLKNDPGRHVNKTESFARVQRVWQTTAAFSDRVQKRIEEVKEPLRIRFEGRASKALAASNAYLLEANQATRISVVWDGNNLVVAENLKRLRRQMACAEDEL